MGLQRVGQDRVTKHRLKEVTITPRSSSRGYSVQRLSSLTIFSWEGGWHTQPPQSLAEPEEKGREAHSKMTIALISFHHVYTKC